MEKNLDTYIRRLIDLDSKAVEFKGERDAELVELEAHSRNELRGFDAVLEEAGIAAKQKHDVIIEAAKLQAKSMDEAIILKLDELQAYFTSFKEDAARDIWKQLLSKSQK